MIEYIDGTASAKSYMVLAKNNGVVLGLRPLFETSRKRTFIGFRLRAAPDSTPGENAVEALETGKTYTSAFPGFPFMEVDEKRASLVGGLFINRGQYQMPEVREIMLKEQAVEKVLTRIQESLGEIQIANKDEIAETLRNEYLSQIEKLAIDGLPGGVPVINNVVHFDKYKAKQEIKALQGGDDEEDGAEKGVETTGAEDDKIPY